MSINDKKRVNLYPIVKELMDMCSSIEFNDNEACLIMKLAILKIETLDEISNIMNPYKLYGITTTTDNNEIAHITLLFSLVE